jgi:asparagine synthetase B (glutamine-hydrolysing)
MYGISGKLDLKYQKVRKLNLPFNESSFKFESIDSNFFSINYLNKIENRSHVKKEDDFFLCVGEIHLNQKVIKGIEASKLLQKFYNKKKLNEFINLNGNFLFFIKEKKFLIIGRSNFSLIPLYYHFHSDEFNFCYDITNLKSNLHEEISFNLYKVGQLFLTNGVILDNNTLLKNINFLRNGELISFKNGKIDTRINNFFTYSAEEKNCEFHLENCSNSFDKALSYIEKDKIIKIGLSGGIDSRILVSLLKKKNFKINTFIYGSKHFDEAQISLDVAQFYKLKHKHIIVDQNDYLKNIKEFIRISNLNGSINQLPQRLIFKNLAKNSKKHNFAFGSALDCTMGDAWQHQDILKFKNKKNLINFYKNQHVFKLNLKKFRDLFYDKKLAEKIYEDCYEKLKKIVYNCQGDNLFDINTSFFLECRGKRWYNNSLIYPLHYTNLKSPFYDKNFLHAISKIPYKLRKNDFFRIKFLKFLDKKVCNFPYNKTMQNIDIHFTDNKKHILKQNLIEKKKFNKWIKTNHNKKFSSTKYDANFLEWLIEKKFFYKNVFKYFENKNRFQKDIDTKKFLYILKNLKKKTYNLKLLLHFISTSIYLNYLNK